MLKTIYMIINYNDSDTTIKLLDNIKDYNILDEVLIIDNASTDNSFNVLSKLVNNKINIIKSDKNKGYSSGINYGLNYIKEKYKDANVFISNADIIIKKENDLIKLIDDINNNDYYVIAPVINEHGYINHGWKRPKPNQEIFFNIPYFHKFFEKKLQYNKKHYETKYSNVDVISGCFFLTRISHMNEINNFDENVFLYYEENIMASKLQKINKKTVIDNEVVIYHDHSISVNKSVSSLKKYKILKNSQYYYCKNYCKSNSIQLFLIKLTSKIAYYILKMYYIISKVIK